MCLALGRYARIIATAWDGATLDLQYDGDEMASIHGTTWRSQSEPD